MGLLTRDQLLTFRPPNSTIEVPELGGSVLVRSLSGREVDQIVRLESSGTESVSVQAKIVRLAVCDTEGKPIFADEDEEKIAALPFAAIARIAKAISEASGLTKQAVDNAEKN